MPIQPFGRPPPKKAGERRTTDYCRTTKPVAVLNDHRHRNNYLAGSGIGCGIVFVESAALNGNNSI